MKTGLDLPAVKGGTVGWDMDNSLWRTLAERDPGEVVMVKASLGTTGYGLSLRFYRLAQRAFGAARTGSVFAFAPFIGAGVAFALGDRSAGWGMALGGVLMLVGVVLHLAESHGHSHEHRALDHEHARRHGDGHHDHEHDTTPTASHSHPNHQQLQRHSHAHVPDAHHAHTH